MSWRGLAGPAALRSSIARRPPALPDCSASYLPRSLGTGTAWNGLLLAVRRSRLLGSSSYVERVPLAVRSSRSLGSQLLREAASRGPPVPIARVQLLREARSSRSSGPDRSSPAPSRSGAPPTSSSIAREPPARDCPTSPCPDCSGHVVVGRVSVVRPGDCSPVHSSEPTTVVENPLLTAVSRCLLASRKFPSESVPVPGDKEMSSGPAATATRSLSQGFRRLFRSTGWSTAGHRLSPENPALSTASSTVDPQAASTCPASGHRFRADSPRDDGSIEVDRLADRPA